MISNCPHPQPRLVVPREPTDSSPHKNNESWNPALNAILGYEVPNWLSVNAVRELALISKSMARAIPTYLTQRESAIRYGRRICQEMEPLIENNVPLPRGARKLYRLLSRSPQCPEYDARKLDTCLNSYNELVFWKKMGVLEKVDIENETISELRRPL